MLALIETLGIAAVMFAATNADDLVLLALFFSQPNASPRHIYLGQLVGIGALTAISFLSALLFLAIPHGFIPWLGVLPLLIGLQWLRRPAHADKSKPPAATRWWAIAGVTLANGADNLGVYIPQFAVQTSADKMITVCTFFLLTLLWCRLAQITVRHPALQPLLSRLCHRAAPWILIGLGIWIIAQHPVFGLHN